MQDRRAIEKEAFSGKLVGIVATNALELGINIGTLDAVIMLGFPMSVASLVSFFWSSYIVNLAYSRRDLHPSVNKQDVLDEGRKAP